MVKILIPKKEKNKKRRKKIMDSFEIILKEEMDLLQFTDRNSRMLRRNIMERFRGYFEPLLLQKRKKNKGRRNHQQLVDYLQYVRDLQQQSKEYYALYDDHLRTVNQLNRSNENNKVIRIIVWFETAFICFMLSLFFSFYEQYLTNVSSGTASTYYSNDTLLDVHHFAI
jgi:hypothetical protein